MQLKKGNGENLSETENKIWWLWEDAGLLLFRDPQEDRVDMWRISPVNRCESEKPQPETEEAEQ